MSILTRLLDPAYLYSLNPGLLGRWWALYVAWAALLVAALGLSLWWRERGGRTASAAIAIASALGLVFLVLRIFAPLARLLPPYARYLLVEVWTARVWPLSATVAVALAAALGLVSRWPLPGLARRHVDALCGALDPAMPPLPAWQTFALGAVHLLGLGFLCYLASYPLWWAALALLLLAIAPALLPPRGLRLETLAPLLFVYAGVGLAVWLDQGLGVEVAEYQAFAFPDPWSPWFNGVALAVAGFAFTGWIIVRLWTRNVVASLSVCLALVGWLLGTVVTHRTHGVTASDPYSYVQMTVDLARTGSPLHDFPLAGLAQELGLPTWPAVHIGYHPPFFGNRSPTMWPIGWSLLMVPFYWLGGLEALYWVAPAVAMLALVATWYLTNEVLGSQSRSVRWSIATLACALVATSPEGTERILVPMADAAAQLFTVFALWMLLRAWRRRPVLHAALAGASFGAAYLVRHPQLPLAVSAVAVALLIARSRTRRLLALGSFAGAALLVALPDLVYHQAVFGGWLRTESTEWFLISVQHVGRSLLTILEQGLMRREELGFIAPFVFYGAGLLWRRQRRAAWIVGSGTLAVFLFHLAYAALRPRDLIAILPVFYICAAYGFVEAWRWYAAKRTVTAALLLVCCAVLISARSVRTLALPWREDVITFGHVSAAQRQAFETLREITSSDAVVGSMLNGGAIELHAKRQAVHPAPWTANEMRLWTDALHARERPFYVLDDGEEMEGVLASLADAYSLRIVARLGLPYFALGGGNLPQTAVLYRVEPVP
jgi:hypothetical protein